MHDARYGFTWFVAPNIMVDHLTVTEGTEDAVIAMHQTLDRLLAKHGAAIRAKGGLRIIGDWRSVKTYTPEARRRFIKELTGGRPIASAVVVVTPANSFLRMAIKAADLALAIASSAKIELSSDVDAVLRRDALGASKVAPLDW